MIDAAEKSENCSKAAAEVFRVKFTEHVYKVVKAPDTDSSAIYHLGTSNDSLVVVLGLQLGTRLVNNFGDLMQNLTIKIDMGDKPNCETIRVDETIDLLKAVDARCHKSLLEFDIKYNACGVNNVFNQIKGPFERVEYVLLDVQNMTEQAEKRQLDAVFPNVKHLQMKCHPLNDSAFIDCNLPKLETLIIDNGKSNKFNERMLVALLKNNPQITNLLMTNCVAPEILGHVAKHLTNLQVLMININQKKSSSKKNERSQNDEDISFLLKYPNVQNLIVSNGLKDAQLLELVGNYPKLTEAVFVFNADVNVYNIKKFFDKSPALTQLTFFHENFSNVEYTIKRPKISSAQRKKSSSLK